MNKEYFHETIKVPDKFLAWVYLQSENGITVVDPHWHRSMEMSYIIKGNVSYEINGQHFIANEKDIVLINSGDIHSCRTNYEGESEMVSIIFPYEFLKSTYPEYNDFRYVLERGTQAYTYVRQEFEEIYPIFLGREENPLYQVRLNGFFYSILYAIFTGCKSSKKISGTIISQKNMDRCTEILDYIDEHYMDNISLESTAEHFSMSKEHMSRTFKNSMATTFKKYLTSVRLHHAFQDLTGSDLSVMQIALDNGFSDARAFTSAFKTYYDETPQNYRKHARDSHYSHKKERFLKTPNSPEGMESGLSEYEKELLMLKKEGIKNSPLRHEYEEKVRGLTMLRGQLMSSGYSTEEVARRLHQERRQLGRLYKEAAPRLFQEYIFYATKQKYGDPLGPDYETLRRTKTPEEIIESSTRPIEDLSSRLTLDGFMWWYHNIYGSGVKTEG